MVKAHEYLVQEQGISPAPFRSPSGITRVDISSASGLLPNPESTPEEEITNDIFASYAIPTQIEDKFVEVEIDSPTKKLWTPRCPEVNKVEKAMQLHKTLFPERTDWQEGIDTWAEEEEMLVPEEVCDDDYEREFDVDPTLSVLAPFNFGEVPFKPFKVYTYADSPNGISHVEFYLGEQLQFQDKTAPYVGTIRPPVTARDRSKREITVRAYDHYGFSTEETLNVRFDKSLVKIREPEGFDELYENRPSFNPQPTDSTTSSETDSTTDTSDDPSETTPSEE